MDSKAKAGRAQVSLKIKFKSETLEAFTERYAVDVSQGGIFIRTKEPQPVGTSMKFEFQLKDGLPLLGAYVATFAAYWFASALPASRH